MIEESVKLFRSTGSECFVCERPIRPLEVVLQVTIKVPILVTTTTVCREAHMSCTERLVLLLQRRMVEAGWLRPPTNGTAKKA